MNILPTDPERQKKLLAGILPLFLVFAYGQFCHGEQKRAIALRQARLDGLEAYNDTTKLLAAGGGSELKEKVHTYEQYMTQLERLLPTREEIPQLLHDVTLRARDLSVDLTLLRPQLRPQTSEPEEHGDYYARQAYELGVRGSYHDVARFLTVVGSLSQIVIATDLQLRRSGAPGGQDRVTLDALLRLQTYVVPAANQPEGMRDGPK